MNNVIFMAKETYSSIKSIEYLIEKNINVIAAVVRKNDTKLIEICKNNNIYICSEEDLLDERFDKCDYIFSFYWKKIKCETLKIAKKGSINFHPGPLPEARGSAYHIAILEDWKYWGVTVHYMDEEFDTGDIIECRHFEIDDKILNYELVEMTHRKLYELFRDTVDKIIDSDELATVKQGKGNYYSIKDIENEKMITLEDDDEMIERKIRAFWNPPYRGAQVNINGRIYTIVNDEILNNIAKNIK